MASHLEHKSDWLMNIKFGPHNYYQRYKSGDLLRLYLPRYTLGPALLSHTQAYAKLLVYIYVGETHEHDYNQVLITNLVTTNYN